MLSFPHSLASNNLAGETGYIKKSKVQGSSFEVGAKVTYEGREMTVSQAPDSDGDIKMMDLSGVMALAASLPECGLTSLECAAAPKCSPFCQRPLTRTCSLTHCPRPTPGQSLLEQNRAQGRLRARCCSQGDADHQSQVRRSLRVGPERSLLCQRPLTLHSPLANTALTVCTCN